MSTRTPFTMLAIAIGVAAISTHGGADPVEASTAPTLVFADDASLASSTPLDGATIDGPVWVGVAPPDGVSAARFWVDVESPTTSNVASTDRSEPFVLGDEALDLAPGSHTVTVKIRTSESYSTITASFTVATIPDPDPDPDPAPDPDDPVGQPLSTDHWVDCDSDTELCKSTIVADDGRPIEVVYKLERWDPINGLDEGFVIEGGVLSTDTNLNGVPDIVDHTLHDAKESYDTYRSWGYTVSGLLDIHITKYWEFRSSGSEISGGRASPPSVPGYAAMELAPDYRELDYFPDGRRVVWHEMFHLFQFSFSNVIDWVTTDNWFTESTANWASARGLSGEPFWASAMTLYSDPSLDLFVEDSPLLYEKQSDRHGTYPFWLYLGDRLGADIIWEIHSDIAALNPAPAAIADHITARDTAIEELVVDFWTASYLLSSRADTPAEWRITDPEVANIARGLDGEAATKGDALGGPRPFRVLLPSGATDQVFSIDNGGAAIHEIDLRDIDRSGYLRVAYEDYDDDLFTRVLFFDEFRSGTDPWSPITYCADPIDLASDSTRYVAIPASCDHAAIITVNTKVFPRFWETEIASGDLGLLAYEGPFSDDDGHTLEGAIEWAHAAGITTGCSTARPDLFCPTDPITRAQMATFLVRALDLPATNTDYFSDDNGNVHEANINAIAAAGISLGCSTGHYCPDDPVRRDQMATFLARALDLPASTTDYFSDDNGNVHEANINAIAAAGISLGCSTGHYCPAASVQRSQMAAFLQRALAP